MKTRRLGRTGLEVSELVLGGGWVGGILIDADDDTRRAAITEALAAGINWIDTAPMYGQGASERALGWLLAELDHKPYLSTKVSLDLDQLDDIRGQIKRQLDASLTRLNIDRFELYQLHNPIASITGEGRLGVDTIVGEGGVADVFADLKAEGYFNHIGITALGETEAIKQVIGSGRFDTAQVYYNLVNPSAGAPVNAAFTGQRFDGLIEACRQQDMGVMVIRIFAAGVLATRRRHGREVMVADGTNVDDDAARADQVFGALGIADGNRAETAIRFGLSHPDVSAVIFGLATLDHLKIALGAATAGPLDARALATLRQFHETAMA